MQKAIDIIKNFIKGKKSKMQYLIFLRGINISGKNKISMQILKNLLEDNDFKNVSTYLNSGNVILKCDEFDKNTLSKKIFTLVKDKFKIDIPIFVTTKDELEDVLNNCPTWWGIENKNVYHNLIFIMPPTTSEEIYSTIGEPSENIDKIEEYNNYIFWSFDLKNYRKSNWWIKTASTSVKDKITIRTARTVKKVLSLCKK